MAQFLICSHYPKCGGKWTLYPDGRRLVECNNCGTKIIYSPYGEVVWDYLEWERKFGDVC